ncbi:TetR/AcrR family transcriptional regulator [Actinomadura macrotermitis]|uniref:Putative HTH-type transcriptional regulator n=1 Tax=Actinomadura macrotermitis TaxID=2585200 RepID=A0A7K0BQX1_9ACTN|nr:TetR/AcrR family transcriptional regulator [Actinomadura macrotermitis]MQY03322.1 putative HTH-type transcriptional regulator [Actinomadura macrotermitis]
MTTQSANPRYRSERSHKAILDAALKLCLEQGFAKTSVDAIAKEAGVGKQTIYRWWPSKTAVLVEAINRLGATSVGFPDTGDIYADLRTQMVAVAEYFRTTESSTYREVIGAAQSDPAAAQAILDTLVTPRVQDCRRRLERAQQQGQIRADADLDDVVELIYAPLYYRLLLGTRPTAPEQVEVILNLVFDGLRPRTPEPASGVSGS